MKREIIGLKPGCCGCCPGHDEFPDDSYGNRRSKRARSEGKAREHRLVRRVMKVRTKAEANE